MVYGAPDQSILDPTVLYGESRGFRIDPPSASQIAVSGAGDVNADGFDDVVVGAPNVGNNSRSRSGSAYVSSADFLPAVTYGRRIVAETGAPLNVDPSRLDASPSATLSVTPALPAGLTLDSVTGSVTGTPTVTGAADYTVTLTDPRRGTARARFRLSVVGATGPMGQPGTQGPVGAQGSSGTGAKGDSGAPGAAGSAGPQGVSGTPGPAGPQGADSEDGRDAKATCKVSGNKRPKVTFRVAPVKRRAVLTRRGHVYARGTTRHLHAIRRLAAGRYVLTAGHRHITVRVRR